LYGVVFIDLTAMSKIGHIKEPEEGENAEVSSVKDFIKSFYNNRQNASLVFHNYKRVVEVDTLVGELAVEEGVPNSTKAKAIIFVWFYFSGFILDYENAQRKTAEVVKRFFNGHDLALVGKERIIAVIDSYWKKEEPEGEDAKLFFDALNGIYFGELFFERNPIWRLEKELTSGRKLSKTEWENQLLNRLLLLKFYSIAAQLRFGQELSNNILTIKRKIERRQNKRDQPEVHSAAERFGNIEPETPIRAIQTYFRTSYRNHISLYAIADKKANIMISVNSIMISVIIIPCNNELLRPFSHTKTTNMVVIR